MRHYHHLQALPLKHISLQDNNPKGISYKEFEAHVKSHKQALEKTKPKDVVCFTGAHTTIVSKNMTLSLEDACNGKAS